MRSFLSRLLRSLNKFNLVPYVFTIFVMRITLTGASIGDALALLSISALVGAKLWLDSKRRPDLSLALTRELMTMKEDVAVLKMSASSSKKPPGFTPRPDQRLF